MISVIIPTLNEQRALPATLDRLFAQAGDFEVIVVDGGSNDATCDIATATAYPGACVLQAPRGRAVQMNAGAARADGEWLLFLHADTLLPDGALAAIQALPDAIPAGGFRHRFSGNGVLLRLISWLDNRRSAATRVFFGDQALFIRRTLFFEMGGFPEQALVEDLVFSRRLVDERRDGRGLPVLMDTAVTTDARKFRQMGVLRSLWRVAVILTCLQLRRPIPESALGFFQNVR